MVARGEDDGHLAATGVFQGAFCGLRSGRASAKMAFEFPIRDVGKLNDMFEVLDDFPFLFEILEPRQVR
jgi:hypothetical protein